MENGSYEEEDQGYLNYAGFYVPFGIVGSVVIIVSIIGNFLIILSYRRDHHLRTVYNFFIANLALCDMIIALMSMPYFLDYFLHGQKWYLSKAFCIMWLFIDYNVTTVTTYLIIVLAADRYCLVRRGPDYFRSATWRCAYIELAVCWVAGNLLYGPFILFWSTWTGRSILEPLQCDVEFYDEHRLLIGAAVFDFAIPFVLLTVISFLIYREIRKRALSIAPVSEISNQDSTTESYNRQVIRRKDIRAAKALAIVVIAYAVCWIPYTITSIVISICEGCVTDDVYYVLTWLLYAKSSINPFLYAYNSNKYKRNIMQILQAVCPIIKRDERRSTTEGGNLSFLSMEHTKG